MTVTPHTSHVRTIAVTAGGVFAIAQLAVFLAAGRGDLAQVTGSAFYRGSCVLLLAGFIGLVFAAFALFDRAGGRAGPLGAAGLAGAVTGTVLMAGDWWFETFAVPFYAEALPQILDVPSGGWLGVGGLASYLTFALGWVLFGVAGIRSGAFSRSAGVAIVIGGLVGYAAVLPPYGVVLGLAVIWAGLNRRGVPATEREPHPAAS